MWFEFTLKLQSPKARLRFDLVSYWCCSGQRLVKVSRGFICHINKPIKSQIYNTFCQLVPRHNGCRWKFFGSFIVTMTNGEFKLLEYVTWARKTPKNHRSSSPRDHGRVRVIPSQICTRNRLKYGFPNTVREDSFNGRRKLLL